MGWFWQSSSSSKPEGSRDSASPTATTPTPPAPTTPTQTPPTEAESNSTDREMAMFMNMLLKDTQSSTSQPKTQQQPPPPATPSNPSSSSSSSSWLPWSSTKPDHPPTTDQQQPTPTKPTRSPQSLAMSEHLLPTTMSCRDAFDYAWHCHTPGAQWNAVYRYGSVRACSELWDDFWFCMRTKSYSPELKAAAVREHYRLKEEAKYGGGRPSSEDVWASRAERVAPGTAFQKSFEAPVMDDAEFQRMDAERRRRIRESEGLLDGNNSGNNSKRG